MASRKCFVCNRKSSSRWFCIAEETSEDVKKCFNVDLFISKEAHLCASCRRDFTRWRSCREPVHDKYFFKANSRGKPGLNKRCLAKENRKLTIEIQRETPSESSPLITLPEDVLYRIIIFLDISDLHQLRLTSMYVNELCSSNFLWRLLLRRDFPDKLHLLDDSALSNPHLAYKIIYSVTLARKHDDMNHREEMSNLLEQSRDNGIKLTSEYELIKRCLGDVRVKLYALQKDQDPSTPVTKLQDQVCYAL